VEGLIAAKISVTHPIRILDAYFSFTISFSANVMKASGF